VALAKKDQGQGCVRRVCLGMPSPEDHWYEAEEGERFGAVNALGEGRVLVTNITGEI